MIHITNAYLKKGLITVLSLTLTTSILAGCGKKDEQNAPAAGDAGSAVSEAASDSSLSAEEIKALYEDFLTGKIKMVVNTDKFPLFPKGNQYSYEEMTKVMSNDIAANFDGEKPLTSALYAFVDCCRDGVPELALTQNFDVLEGISEVYLFSVQNGQVCLGTLSEGYYRTYTDVNQFGILAWGGSNSAWGYSTSYSTLNKDGEEVFLYSVDTQMGLSEAFIEKYALPDGAVPEDYPIDMYSDDCDDYVTSDRYSFIEYSGDDSFDDNAYRKACFFAFYKDDRSYVAPSAEYASYYDKAGIKYYSLDDAEKLVDEHVKELGFDPDSVAPGDAAVTVDWISLSTLGVGTYSQVPVCKADVVSELQGNWIYQTEDASIDKLYLEVKPDADFQVDVSYKEKNKAPQYAKGHLAIDENSEFYPPSYTVTFVVEDSNMDYIDDFMGLGAYYLSSVTTSGKEVVMNLNVVEGYSSYFEDAFTDFTPVFTKEYKEEHDLIRTYISMYGTSTDPFNYNEEATATPPALTEVSCKENGITDEDLWFAEVGYDTSNPYTIGDYTYEILGEEKYYCYTKLNVYDAKTKELLYTFDLHDLKYAEGYENYDFVDRSIHYAEIVGHDLYINLYHRTYAESCPYNAYVIAIDLDYNSYDWQSEPLMCNCNNFVVKDDVIIAGYGFTDEDHYLTVLNRYNGNLIQKIPLKKSPEYMKLDGDKLYVRTYSYDYIFDVK